MDEVNKFLGEFGQNTDGTEGEITLPEVEGEIAPEAEPEVPEEKIPFHKVKDDPKFQRFLEKEIDKRMKDFQPSRTEQFSKQVQEENPYTSYAEKLMGTDTNENKTKSKILADTLLEIQSKAAESSYARFSEESKALRQQEIDSIDELQEGIDGIEDKFGVDLSSNSVAAKKTRNDFLDFLGRISPKDQNGEIKEYADMDYSFEEFSKRNKPELNTQAKQIVSRGMAASTAQASSIPTRRVTAGNLRSVLGLE